MLAISNLPSDGSDWGLTDPTFSFSHDVNSPLRNIECGKRDQYPLDEKDMVYSPDKPEEIHTMHFVIDEIEEEESLDPDYVFIDSPVLSYIRANLSLLPKCMVTDPNGDVHYVYKCYSFTRPIYYTISDNIVSISRNRPVYPFGSTCSDFDVSLLLDHRPRFVEATYLLSFSPVDTMMIFGGRYDVVGKFFRYERTFWEDVKDHLMDIVHEQERRRVAEQELYEYTEMLFSKV